LGAGSGSGSGAGSVVYCTGKLEVGCWTCDGGKFASANGASDLEAGCGGEIGGERHPSSCGICLFFANTAARLLDRVASLTVFARLRGGGCRQRWCHRRWRCRLRRRGRRCWRQRGVCCWGGLTGGSRLSRGGGFVGCGCVKAGLRAVSPPFGPGLPPPFITFPPPGASLASRLTCRRRGSGAGSRRRLDSADNGKLFQAVTRIIQHPRPAAVVHALVVEVQEAGGD
jgi:hypothetical protein